MTVAILSLLGVVLGFAARWYWQRAARLADPKERHRRRYEAIDAEIVRTRPGDPVVGLGDDLDELERLQRAKSARGAGGPAGGASAGR